MLNILWSLFAFLVAITVLVAVHEYGHYFVARRLGVKVIRFSIGFGKVLWKIRDKRGCDFAISILPFGGYVKMLDEREGPVAPEELAFAFNRQSPVRRIAIASAGPVINILFAIVAFWIIYCIGIPGIAPIIGSVEPNSLAAQSGLTSGDEIVRIDDTNTPNWSEVELALLAQAGNNNTINIIVKTAQAQTQLYPINFSSWYIDVKDSDLIKKLGIKPYEPPVALTISKTIPNGPAALAGFQAQDKIIAINNKPVASGNDFIEWIAAHPDQTLTLTAEREGKILTRTVHSEKIMQNGQAHGRIGVIFSAPPWPSSMIRLQRYPVYSAGWPALKQTWHVAKLSIVMMGKLVMGEASVKTLSGPIGIAEMAGQTLHLGFVSFLSFLALISISLAIVNILPIPMLDGGHILYAVVEIIRKKPLSEAIQEFGYRLGIIFLLCLMILAFINDINRV